MTHTQDLSVTNKRNAFRSAFLLAWVLLLSGCAAFSWIPGIGDDEDDEDEDDDDEDEDENFSMYKNTINEDNNYYNNSNYNTNIKKKESKPKKNYKLIDNLKFIENDDIDKELNKSVIIGMNTGQKQN